MKSPDANDNSQQCGQRKGRRPQDGMSALWANRGCASILLRRACGFIDFQPRVSNVADPEIRVLLQTPTEQTPDAVRNTCRQATPVGFGFEDGFKDQKRLGDDSDFQTNRPEPRLRRIDEKPAGVYSRMTSEVRKTLGGFRAYWPSTPYSSCSNAAEFFRVPPWRDLVAISRVLFPASRCYN